MKEFTTPEALLFDMDGVLVDSLQSWLNALNKALTQEDQETISKETFIDKYWGHTLQENLEKLGINQENKQFCHSFYTEYVDNVVLFPGTKQVLEDLNDYPKAIITNTPKPCTKEILENFEIDHFFSVIITSDQTKQGKPAPDMIYEACKHLNIPPEQTVLIGDTQNDIKAGQAAGCKTIGIKTQADITLDSIEELPTVMRI